jgi:uncharacterized phiE125 gp8 family phage protein
MRRTLKLITDSTAEPVSVADLKLFMRLSTVSTTEDALLAALEKAARKHAENFTQRPCMPQTFQLVMDGFPGSEIILPRAPLSSTASDVAITYLDAVSANSTSLSTSVYGVDTLAEPPRVFLLDGQDWPDHYTQRNAVTVQFVAGYPLDLSSAPAPPEGITNWIKMRVSQMYECREPMQAGNMTELPRSYVDGLLDPYVLIDVRP